MYQIPPPIFHRKYGFYPIITNPLTKPKNFFLKLGFLLYKYKNPKNPAPIKPNIEYLIHGVDGVAVSDVESIPSANFNKSSMLSKLINTAMTCHNP